MRLDLLCEAEFAYRVESAYGTTFVLARPYGGEEGSGYGEGDGILRGARLSGTARWVNHPHRRSDGTMLPDTYGVITTVDGAHILYTLQGRTVFDGDDGSQLLTVTFESEDERYRWLNDTFCVLEGAIDAAKFVFVTRIYQCINEMIEST